MWDDCLSWGVVEIYLTAPLKGHVLLQKFGMGNSLCGSNSENEPAVKGIKHVIDVLKSSLSPLCICLIENP